MRIITKDRARNLYMAAHTRALKGTGTWSIVAQWEILLFGFIGFATNTKIRLAREPIPTWGRPGYMLET